MGTSNDREFQHFITFLKRKRLSAKQRSEIAQLVELPRPKQKTPKRKTPWWHAPDEERPPEFEYGPLMGTAKDLSEAVAPTNRRRAKPDSRPLRSWAQARIIWVVRPDANAHCSLVWFRTAKHFEESKMRYNEIVTAAPLSA